MWLSWRISSSRASYYFFKYLDVRHFGPTDVGHFGPTSVGPKCPTDISSDLRPDPGPKCLRSEVSGKHPGLPSSAGYPRAVLSLEQGLMWGLPAGVRAHWYDVFVSCGWCAWTHENVAKTTVRLCQHWLSVSTRTLHEPPTQHASQSASTYVHTPANQRPQTYTCQPISVHVRTHASQSASAREHSTNHLRNTPANQRPVTYTCQPISVHVRTDASQSASSDPGLYVDNDELGHADTHSDYKPAKCESTATLHALPVCLSVRPASVDKIVNFSRHL